VIFIKSPIFSLLILATLLQGCGSATPKPPKSVDPYKGGISAANLPPDWDIKDGTPLALRDPNNIADAVPRRDTITGAGNRSPYTILGETYYLMSTGRGFKQRGIGSWYGTKFHGKKTANGEDYDVYSMTAAHKTLPIPCYVRVTNLENGRRAVVRVNDRGPFVGDRVIDLSYAAATKLGYANKGTALLELEYIDTNNIVGPTFAVASVPTSVPPVTAPLKPSPYYVSRPNSTTPQPLPPAVAKTPLQLQSQPQSQPIAAGTLRYLQAGAFSNYDAAHQLADKLQRELNRAVYVNSDKPKLYRVHVGPIPLQQVEAVRAQLAAANIPNAHFVQP